MTGFDRRQFLVGAGLVAARVSLPGGISVAGAGAPATQRPSRCWGPGSTVDDVLAPPGSKGMINEGYYQRRVRDYLDYATGFERFSSPPGIAVHLIQAHRDRDHEGDSDHAHLVR